VGCFVISSGRGIADQALENLIIELYIIFIWMKL
jgi:hypothetical protein